MNKRDKLSNTYENCLEILPNELFLWIFSYLKSDTIIPAFLDLNQRFRSLIYEFTSHLLISNDSQSGWINRYIPLINNEIQTMKLDIECIVSVFSNKYSFPNLRSIIIYRKYSWHVELNIENETPIISILSSLKVLRKCSFNGINQKIFAKLDSHILPHINNMNCVLPCLSIHRLWIYSCYNEKLTLLQDLAPKMIYLNIEYNYVYVTRSNSSVPSTYTLRANSLNLTELSIKLNDFEFFAGVQLLVNYYQSSLRRLTFDLRQELLIDGQKLETCVACCNHLENFSFIIQCHNNSVNMIELLHSFQTEWWLDHRRSPVLIHSTKRGNILIASMPCSFLNISKNFQFSTILSRWYLNKDKFNSPLIRFLKTNYLCFSNEQEIDLEYLLFIARIFYSQKQMIECTYWGLMSEEELFEPLTTKLMEGAVLPNVTRLNITNVKGLTLLTLALWLLLAPNIRLLNIESIALNESIEWILELFDAFTVSNHRFKMIFRNIQKISISGASYNYSEKSKLYMHSLLAQIFSSAVMN
ncbi:hypothetical protein I4U23_023000 [Adineta vaga]|nr:hypothetical protein I4U23_023000 [Adineta vaga]